MNATVLIIPVGQRCHWRASEKIRVLCEVADSRSVWGRVDLLLRPVQGTGEQWVSIDKVDRLPGKAGTEIVAK